MVVERDKVEQVALADRGEMAGKADKAVAGAVVVMLTRGVLEAPLLRSTIDTVEA